MKPTQKQLKYVEDLMRKCNTKLPLPKTRDEASDMIKYLVDEQKEHEHELEEE